MDPWGAVQRLLVAGCAQGPGFGAHYTTIKIKKPQNSIGKYFGPYSTSAHVRFDMRLQGVSCVCGSIGGC